MDLSEDRPEPRADKSAADSGESHGDQTDQAADPGAVAESASPVADEPPRPTIAESALRAATAGVSSGSDEHEESAAEPGGPSVDATFEAESEESQGTDSEAVTSEVTDGVTGGESAAEDDENAVAWRAVPLTTRVEALLFAATSPLSLRRLQTLAGDVDTADVRDALASLQAHYEATARAFGIQEIGGGYQLRTNAELSELLARLGRKTSTEKLSPASIETLAIVAYRQPVMRVDVEKIRGVASGDVLRSLIEKGLVRVAGRADLPGSPLLYGTTPAFLEGFGLRDLRDLPSDRELLRRSV